ncbi:branched-chain amino acid ABC transporter permease [Agrobacterium tumefaciens]|uniref:branched-chain amino acid ABC transporter permease n=1 Tax=Agrobacterium tumefaciens TaxID=358 RepID=UPI001574B7CB|nr:branched-chain amino acid ABC transporter permease [Agrobacterium tumefaciens]NTC82570.1 branched-chain amino acid ABC transporter permease [Agrobacterium tumefaciens]NTD11393.1 branched-chain amino acid ABC transporter permease [Agrobacterium tumefaciens]NTD88292.1 branched-chain amino acid ABC transporter permease [Agrobacterium tumefaciens]NTD92601.1 branched-chain amino acid ABC transporter permease [Agrobacterium tumefaciens]NTE00930.1 branched-chain amino acid ABC transporter permease
MSFFLFNALNGLQLSMLLFLMAIGLTIIFGLMDTLNLAHGAFYMVGAYFGYALFSTTGNFWLALLIAPLLPILIGFVLQFFVLQPLKDKGRSAHLDMALLTFGLLFFVIGAIDLIFFETLGLTFLSIDKPEFLRGAVNIGILYPTYRLFIIIVGLTVALSAWFLLERTVLGAVVRAGVDDNEMVRAMGINIYLVFALVFALGCGLAGFAGVVAGAELSIDVNMGVQILIPTLVVVILGGLGSVKGCFIGAIIVGMTDTLTQAYLPEASTFAIYILLTATLIVRPLGLFGRPQQTI